ncbi:MATE family efflux transporter [Mangrovibacillus cuniculi]|uniref:MATE family efflux transporter n=1 Tax=Mangrovibacillus cuniculi TaxID=2593652 RepID=A0A7S8HES9_9BACI|nr:MATE family efflux transporter [Mangrovibacillus cuniculi]QPC46042.1 MATE family efflux transporter [Mangrovibacillus cuniculi]
MKKVDGKKLTLFALTWPIFIEIALHMLMGNADTLMLSQYSDSSVAAVGLSNQILFLVIVMFGFVATGTSILISQYLGANQDRKAKEVAVISLGANLAFGLLLSLALYFLQEPILRSMNVPDELFLEASDYLVIIGAFSFVQALIMTVGAVVRSYGYTRDIMFITIGMNIVNVIGNYFVIFGPFGFPVLGVEGVALSTTISRFIGFIVAIGVLIYRVPGALPWISALKQPWEHLKNLLRIGIPSAGEHLSYNASQIVITYFIAAMGTEALTTKVYAQNVMMFIFLFAVAVGQGTQILIGHMIGGKQYEEAYERCLKSLKIAIFISFASAIVFSLFAKPVLGIFTSNEAILTTGSILIYLTILLEPGRAFNLVVISSLRAAGDVKYPVYIGIASMWGVAVVLAYTLGVWAGLGLIGVWIAFAADEWLRGILMLRRWRKRGWVKMSYTQ